MAYNVFRSDDAGAPSLTGQVSKLIDLLDACLVNGFNTKTITITRSGSTATATCSSHGFRDQQNLTISGASQTEYNGSFVISNVTTNTFDFTVSGSPATPATGTISAKVTPLGWTKPYTGTNLAAFRMGGAVGSGPQGYLRVDDTGTTDARIYGHAAMSDVNTGTDRFPTNAQVSGGFYFRKSGSADATVRGWVLWGNEKLFFLQAYGNVSGATLTANSTSYDPNGSNHSMIFGGFYSYTPSDPWNLLLIAPSSATVGGMLGTTGANLAGPPSAWTNLYVCRDYQAIASKSVTITSMMANVRPAMNTTCCSSFPSGISGTVPLFFDTYLLESEVTSLKFGIRGYIPGWIRPWCDLITGTRRYFDTMSASGEKYLFIPTVNGSASDQYAVIAVKLGAPDSTWSVL